MPIYKFKCNKCGQEYEELVTKRGDTAPCPKCGCEKAERLVSTPGKAVIKGGGAASGGGPSCGCSGACGHSH